MTLQFTMPIPQTGFDVKNSQSTTPQGGRWVLRAHGLFLCLASVSAMRNDLLGIFFEQGPVSSIVAKAPYSGIGFVEAHGLAFLLSLWLLSTQPQRPWHLTGAGIALLLGTCNLAFWQIFIGRYALGGILDDINALPICCTAACRSGFRHRQSSTNAPHYCVKNARISHGDSKLAQLLNPDEVDVLGVCRREERESSVRRDIFEDLPAIGGSAANKHEDGVIECRGSPVSSDTVLVHAEASRSHHRFGGNFAVAVRTDC